MKDLLFGKIFTNEGVLSFLTSSDKKEKSENSPSVT